MLELLRRAARQPPEILGETSNPPENVEAAHLLGVMTEKVRAAEVNEARARFSRLSDDEKKRRFNSFRREMQKVIRQVARHAPGGLDEFCQAVEAALFPYPEPMDFIRHFARALHTNASSSTLFDNIQTPQGVEQRYEAVLKSRQGNPLVIEIARELALSAFKMSDREEKKAYMREVDLHEEFGWPTSINELHAQM